jgi:hypothetical protein
VDIILITPFIPLILKGDIKVENAYPNGGYKRRVFTLRGIIK